MRVYGRREDYGASSGVESWDTDDNPLMSGGAEQTKSSASTESEVSDGPVRNDLNSPPNIDDSDSDLYGTIAVPQPPDDDAGTTVYGTTADDPLFGGDGRQVVLADDGDDYVNAAAGNDVLYGAAAADWLEGSTGQDLEYGGAAADYAAGGAGSDTLYGGAADDALVGGTGNDVLYGDGAGDNGNDVIYADGVVPTGPGGDDTVYGGDGNDLLDGGAGNDAIFGGADSDQLMGDAGRDRLDGGSGNDVLIGGSGVDLFAFGPSSGHDTIVDFEAGTDRIDLGDLGFTSFANFLAGGGSVTNPGSGGGIAVVSLGGGAQVDVYLDPGETLASDDFIFNGNGAPLPPNEMRGNLFGNDADGDSLSWSGGGTGTFGSLSVDSETGQWTYTLDASDPDTEALRLGDIAFDTFTVTASDGHTIDTAQIAIEVDGQIVPAPVIDLTSLTSALGFVIQGNWAGGELGEPVAAAGDVNGDGYADLIVGAYRADDGGADAGEAYIVFGSASGFGTAVTTAGVARQVIDVASLVSSQGFIIQGDSAGDQAAYSVASAGDVNGDGYADLLVGDVRGDDGGYDAGEAYVVFGSASGFGVAVTTAGVARQVVDLTSLTSSQGFIIQGDNAGDFAGISASGAGDVNGDGYDDLIVGAIHAGDGGHQAGEAYVIFGRAGGFGIPVTTSGVERQVVDLTSLTSSLGFLIQGDNADDHAGSVSGLGDINGDGYDDLIVGGPFTDDGGANTGGAYVLFGTPGGFGSAVTTAGVVRQVIDLTSLGSAQGFVLQGYQVVSWTGLRATSAGDLNGDGYQDFAISAFSNDEGGTNAGEVYVLFGSPGSFGTTVTTGGVARQVIDLASLSSSQGFVIRGEAAHDYLGLGVASAGDVNGDGYDDLIAGATGSDIGGINAGEAYVLFGSAGGFGIAVTTLGAVRQVIDLSGLTAEQGFRIQGDNALDYSGEQVSSAGDLNGDGYDDIVVGAYGSDAGGTDAGAAYVIFGAPTGAASVHVLSGTAGANTLIGDRLDDTLSGGGGLDVLRGGAGNDHLSVADTSFLDVDGGNGDDTLALAGTGLVLDLRLATPTKLESIETIDLTGSGNNTLVVDQLSVFHLTEQRVGGSEIVHVRGNAGDTVQFTDVGWGFEGTIVEGGTTWDRYIDGNAELRIQHGVAATDVVDLTSLTSSQGFIVQGDTAEDHLGWGLAAADINGDGFADLVVGAYYGDDGGDRSGEAYVVFGSASGFGTAAATAGVARQVVDLTSLVSSQGFIIQGDTVKDYAGYSVACAGDVNGDGYGDLIIGAYGNDDGGSGAGDAYVVFGSGSGFGVPVTTVDAVRQVLDLTSLSSVQGFIIQGDNAGDQTGRSVSGGGDVNGDGYDDLIVGAYQADGGGGAAGAAYVIFGSAGGFGSSVGGRQVVDLTSLTSAQGFIIQGDTAGDNAGVSVSGLGDINGDGYGDLAVGAWTGDDGGSDAGEAYVIFGSAGSFGVAVTTAGVVRQVIDLTSLVSSQGFIVQGDTPNDNAGLRVVAVGDLNGDGHDDFAVSAMDGDDGGTSAGEVYVLFGSAGTFGIAVTTGGVVRQVIDLTSLDSSQGFIVQGETDFDRLGHAVASAGDVNGDGYDDLIVGAYGSDLDGIDAGEAYVLFGSASAFGVAVTTLGAVRQVLDLASLTPAQGFRIQGDSPGDFAGLSVSSAGDLNGDGYDDIVVGAIRGDDGGADAGEAYVIFGAPTGSASPIVLSGGAGAQTLIGDHLDDTLSGGGGLDVLHGGAGNDHLSVADTSFLDVDGGTGSDALALTGSGLVLDLRIATPTRLESIEHIDLTGTGNNTLIVDDLAFFRTTELRGTGVPAVEVTGNAGDKVQLDTEGAEVWNNIGSTVVDGVTYDRYVFDPDGVGALPPQTHAELWLDQHLTVQLI